METAEKVITLPLKVGKYYEYSPDCFVRIVHIELGLHFYKVYIALRNGKVIFNKIIKVLNEQSFFMARTFFIVGTSIKADLVNGKEIL